MKTCCHHLVDNFIWMQRILKGTLSVAFIIHWYWGRKWIFSKANILSWQIKKKNRRSILPHLSPYPKLQNLLLKEGVHQFYKFVLKCKVRYAVTAVKCDFPQICFYTAWQLFRFLGTGSPGTQSWFSGTQSRLSGNTIKVLREHNLGSPGTQSSRFEENHI